MMMRCFDGGLSLPETSMQEFLPPSSATVDVSMGRSTEISLFWLRSFSEEVILYWLLSFVLDFDSFMFPVSGKQDVK